MVTIFDPADIDQFTIAASAKIDIAKIAAILYDIS
jgi:hypothetical protein